MSYNTINLLFAILCIFVHINAALQCFSTDNDNYKCHFGKKTPYRYIANHNDSLLNYPGCTAKKIWLLIRHGTRFPDHEIISQINNVLPTLKQQLIDHYKANESKVSEEVVNKLVEWNLTLAIEDQMKLVEEGERELVDLAERFQERFPNLLSEIYSNQTYKFKYTPLQRTEESAKNFALGLFGHNASQNVWYNPPEKRDDVLRSYKHCDRWQSEVKKNPAAHEQTRLFQNSEIFNKTLDEISDRLGFRIDYDLTNVMFSTCVYETAWKEDANSPWCNLLSLENFKVMEYDEDLKVFWVDGYGYPITYEQSCPALRDVFQFFETVSELKATAYFTHSGSILKLLAHLGLAKDDIPLTHDSYELHRDNRAWRTSRIDTFAANIGFILYECEEDEPSIIVMHQERVVHIPGCPENIPCPISVMKAIFSRSINECNHEEICKLDRV